MLSNAFILLNLDFEFICAALQKTAPTFDVFSTQSTNYDFCEMLN